MPDLDLTSLYTAIGGVFGTPAAIILNKLNFTDNLNGGLPYAL